jgi:LacI family transcriptional regulator
VNKRPLGSSAAERQPTIRDVARLAGVAPITVSRVINNSSYISPETRERVETAIAKLHYVPNSISRSLRFKKTNMLAMLVSDITNPFWTTVTRGAEDASSAHGLNIILCNTDEKQDKFADYVDVLLQKQIDGFLLAPTGDDGASIARIQKQRVPYVLIDRVLPDVHADSVRSDSITGAYLLTRHLIELGHRRIAIITAPTIISTGRERLQGYLMALEEAAIPADPRLIHYGGYQHETGYYATYQALRSADMQPTALFAGNNFIATGILKALDEHGLRVPEDMSVVSFDDLPYGFYRKPFMTVAVQAPYTLGYEAAQLLIQRVNGSTTLPRQEIILPVELIIRDSCAPPSNR